jgi:hypothetical protein
MATIVKDQATPRAVIDTRQSIMRRLMGYIAERRRLEQRIGVITVLEKELQEILREIDQRGQQPSLLPEETPSSQSGEGEIYSNTLIKDLLQRALQVAPRTLDDLVRIVLHSGINFGEKSPARVIHFNLLNLKNAGLIDRNNDMWRLVERK